jgi:hypothetical protein
MSNAKEQQKTKPKIEDVVKNVLHGENLDSVTSLITFIRENKISLRWVAQNCWQLYFKGSRIGYIRMTDKYRKNYALPDNSWVFSGCVDVLDILVANDNKAKDLVWNNVRLCSNCCGCGPGKDKMIYDKQFEKTCNEWFRILNPDTDTVTFIKMMLKEKVRQLANSAK